MNLLQVIDPEKGNSRAYHFFRKQSSEITLVHQLDKKNFA